MPTIIGEHPLAKDADGRLKSRIATVFPFADTIVTLPGIHATQRIAFLDVLESKRREEGRPPLSAEEQSALFDSAVDWWLTTRRSSSGPTRPTCPWPSRPTRCSRN